jgi:HD-like signal output (HDOD) protein
MIFQGELSKYHPADALMFLSQLSLNGVLSVSSGPRLLTLDFKDGFLLDAHSAAGDEKILRVLRFRKHIDPAQEQRIRQIRSETGMRVRQILAEVKLFPLTNVRKILELGIQEVLLELFLMENGTFNFTDALVDDDGAGIKLTTGSISITVLSQADEMRNFEKAVVSLDRQVGLKVPAPAPAEGASCEERVLAHLTAQPVILRHLIATAPFESHRVMQLIEALLSAEGLRLLPLPETGSPVPAAAAPVVDPLFVAYKQALKSVLSTEEVLKKLEAVIAFCKNFYDGILILSAKESRIVHCKSIAIEGNRNVRQKTFKGDLGAIQQDPVFQAVQRSAIGFFGQIFPSQLIGQWTPLPPKGECGLFPILSTPQLALFCYVYTQNAYTGLTPHHYLELLAWMLNPGSKSALAKAAEPAPPPPAGPEAPPVVNPADEADGSPRKLFRMVERIDDLPPFPALATRTLETLARPNASMEEVEKTLAQDQALVAKIIKVSNSALYGGYQKIASLRNALTRLGVKTTKSLILAASTRGYFFKNRNVMNTYGQFLWQHAVETGMACRRIAEGLGLEDPEQAFIAGIMHDIGKLVILMLDDEKYKEIQRLKTIDKLTTVVAEKELLGTDHGTLGRLLMEKWRMPEAVQVSAQYHHTPAQAPEYGPLAYLVAYGDYLSHQLSNHPLADHFEDELLAGALKRTLGLAEPLHTELIARIQTDFQSSDILGEN